MIVPNTITGIIAVVLAYLIGAVPSAYIITRLLTGKDIRKLGTGHTGVGNVGARNVFVNVGKIPGVCVGIFDIGKGAGAVFLAAWMMGWPRLAGPDLSASTFFVLGAGMAAVVGHIWPVYLRFVGGGGLATALGVLAVLMTYELLLALAIAVVLVYATRNVLLSVNLSLISVPINAWVMSRPWWMVAFPVLLLVIMLAHFLPNIIAEIKKARSLRELLDSLLRRDKTRKRGARS